MTTFIVTKNNQSTHFKSIVELEFHYSDEPKIKQILDLIETFPPGLYSQITMGQEIPKIIYALIATEHKVERI